MSQSRPENVVAIGTPRARLDAAVRGPLVSRIRAQVRDGLTQRLHVMLEQVDDALFARAEHADSNQLQTAYFDAMREVRLKRPALEADFSALVLKHFDQGLQQRRAPTSSSRIQSDPDDALSLVETDELEEKLAVDAMVTKAKRLYAEPLYLLGQRLAAMAGTPAPSVDEEMAIGPEVICAAFQEASAALEIDIQIRLLLFKLFDHDVINDLGEFYSGIDLLLREAGILPTLTAADAVPAPRRGRNKSGTRTEQAVGEQEGANEAADDITQALRQFLYGPDQMPPGTGGGVAPGVPLSASAGSGYAPGGNSTVITVPVVQALSRLQQVGSDDYRVAGGLSLDPAALKRGLAEGSFAGGTVPVRPLEERTIDIVAMLFDFLFEDPDLPGQIKNAVARLQIPVLKVALIDPEFFSRKQHPARRLLNQLAHAGIGWSPEADDPDDGLLQCIDRLVGRVVNEFEDNVEIFSAVLEDFESWVGEADRRSSVREEAAVDAVLQEENRLLARSAAAVAIDSTIADARLPDTVRAFLVGPWKDLLARAYRADGGESPTWDRVLNVASTLVWSLMPKTTDVARRQLLDTLPSLLRALRDGMERMRIAAPTRDDLLSSLAVEHTRLARSPRVLPRHEALADSHRADAAGVSEADEEAVDGDAKSFMAKKAAEINRMIDEGRFLGGAGVSNLTDEGPHDHHYERAESLGEGAWLDWRDQNGCDQRIKLSWKSVISGKYFFVNRQGMKIVEMNVHALAGEMRDGRARIIEDAPMVDRALLSVLDTLQQGV